MKQEIKTELYTSPTVEVIETQAQQVICTSSESQSTVEQEGLDGYIDFEW